MDFQAFKEKFEKVPVVEVKTDAPGSPLISVCVQTFQHAPYIRQCLDGILMQEVNFEYEILLGEDASTDGTREICQEYAEKFPDKIRLFLHRRENNIIINDSPTGRFNMLYNLFSARGKYIALCEGDDYWTDPLKLQSQVNFLEANEEFSICFHKVKVLENGELKEDYITKIPSEVSTINELAKRNYIHTPSCTFRNILDKVIRENFIRSPLGDYYLYLMNSQYGKIFYINRSMAIYRVHNQSYWSKQSKTNRLEKTCQSILTILEVLDKNFVQARLNLVGQFFQYSTNFLESDNSFTPSNKTLFAQMEKFAPELILYILKKEKELNRRQQNSTTWKKILNKAKMALSLNTPFSSQENG